METDHIEFKHPFFLYILGKSNSGKTFFTNEMVRNALKNKFKILYVVNSAFEVEEEIIELLQKNKNVYLIKCKDLKQNTMDIITKSLVSEDKKLIIVDNFTYSLTLEFLNFTTFSRKYNASVIFIAHSLFASRTISPRLRELVTYFMFFYLPKNNNLKFVMDENLFKVFVDEIKFRSFKFLLIDQPNSEYLVSKIPEFKPVLTWEKDKEKKKKKNYEVD